MNGERVFLVELTTVEASKMLAVSRQFLIGLLEQRQIPCIPPGKHTVACLAFD